MLDYCKVASGREDAKAQRVGYRTRMDRRSMLEDFLKQHPADSFARYGLAMEHVRLGRDEDALQQFAVLLEQNPQYTAAYQQAGQLLLKLGRMNEARAMLVRGAESARREGNQHAAEEMQGLLDEL